MKAADAPLIQITSIAEQHRALGLPGPLHPLLSLVRFEDLPPAPAPIEQPIRFTTDFYTLSLKKGCRCKVKYGQSAYDFDAGVMSCFAPRQLLTWSEADSAPESGWLLSVHPAYLQPHPLGQSIRAYGFFQYAANEALLLSEQEEDLMTSLFEKLQLECARSIDQHSQPILLSHLELLLSYINRFYSRQFLTRKTHHTDTLARVERVLLDYLDSEKPATSGIPTVKYLADSLNMSADYLGEVLRTETGLSSQQHIHQYVVEKAKELLASSTSGVSEIAYRLGFEHSQSFNRFFKQKTNRTPLGFRQLFP